MTKDFLTYKIFTEESSAEEFGRFLINNKIEYELEKSSLNFEFANSFNEMSNEYRIKLKQEDFAIVNDLLAKEISQQLDEVDKDYYLFSFIDEELFEIISKPDEWSHLDYLLAQKILKDRGRTVNLIEIESLNKKRIEDLSKPESKQKWWIIFGYTVAVFGGLFAILIGWQLYSHKKTLPNGNRVSSYSDKDRRHGLYIFTLGICCMSFWIGYRIVRYLSR